MLAVLDEYQRTERYEKEYREKYAEPSLYGWKCPSCSEKVVQVPRYEINLKENTIVSKVVCENCKTSFVPSNNGRYDIGPYDTPELMFIVSHLNRDINVGKFSWVWKQLPNHLKYSLAFKFPTEIFAYYWNRISEPFSLTIPQLDIVYPTRIFFESKSENKLENKPKIENKPENKQLENKPENKQLENKPENKQLENKSENKKLENKSENKKLEISVVEKICIEVLGAIYVAKDRGISVDFDKFVEEAKKLKVMIEEAEPKIEKDEKKSNRNPLAHKQIPDDVYDALPPIPEEQRIVEFKYPWNPKSEKYLREWNRHYNGMGQPFTLPTKLIYETE